MILPACTLAKSATLPFSAPLRQGRFTSKLIAFPKADFFNGLIKMMAGLDQRLIR